MAEKLLFLTGKLAEPALRKVLAEMAPVEFDFDIHQLGLSVAALMTDKMIERRLADKSLAEYDQIIVPGRCRGDLEKLSKEMAVPIVRGPEEVKDLPLFFGKEREAIDLSRYDVKIFAEIVDAPELDIHSIISRAMYYREAGANVIDIGCLPAESFPHMEEAIEALHEHGFEVSVDSLELADLKRASKAGANYLLSLSESNYHLAEECEAIPVLVPAKPGSMSSLERVMELMDKLNKPWIADPILDPIHFGLTESIVRYYELRKRYPDAEIMMGVGNLTELTDADTSGINALLFGIISELDIRNVLATEVSPHARKAIKQADIARRLMYAAKQDSSLPRDFTSGLLVSHDRRPFPDSEEEIAELASNIKDPNYRIKVTESGIHMFNRDGLIKDIDPFSFYPKLQLKEDELGHAFYLGAELARAQIAWQLGKRYNQDEELSWGGDVKQEQQDLTTQKQQGTTMTTGKECGPTRK